jgi:cytochrome c-type biogenesis protein CcmE
MKKIAIPALLLLVGLVGLITMGVIQGAIPELQVHELLADRSRGPEVKVHGIIERIDKGTRPLDFMIRDKAQEGVNVRVLADQSMPDTFQVDYDIAVQGRFDAAAGAFRADKIFTKCPSKYEADEKLGITSSAKAEAPRSPAPPDGVGAPPAKRAQ